MMLIMLILFIFLVYTENHVYKIIFVTSTGLSLLFRLWGRVAIGQCWSMGFR